MIILNLGFISAFAYESNFNCFCVGDQAKEKAKEYVWNFPEFKGLADKDFDFKATTSAIMENSQRGVYFSANDTNGKKREGFLTLEYRTCELKLISSVLFTSTKNSAISLFKTNCDSKILKNNVVNILKGMDDFKGMSLKEINPEIDYSYIQDTDDIGILFTATDRIDDRMRGFLVLSKKDCNKKYRSTLIYAD